MEGQDWEKLQRMMDERVSAAYHSDQIEVTNGAIWAAFVDFRGEVRTTLGHIIGKQDTTNNRLNKHDTQIAMFIGGMGVLTTEFLVLGALVVERVL